MKLRVHTTTRQIRTIFDRLDEGLIDRYMSIGEFFGKAILVPGKRYVDGDLRKLFLYRALQRVDADALGLSKDFMRFFKNADFVLDFFAELAKERVDIVELDMSDTYAEYSEHLRILDALRQAYLQELEREGLVDSAMIERFEINEAFFEQYDEVELEVLGYLSRYEREILRKVPVPVSLRFVVSRFNKPLIHKMFGEFEEGVYLYDFQKGEVLSYKPLRARASIESASFGERIWQVHYVLACIEELLELGCDPDKIAVILPDESFESYLDLFNNGNLNFAMGRPFAYSKLFIKLKALYDYLIEGDEVAKEKASDYIDLFEDLEIVDLVRQKATEREMIVIEEELHRLEALLPYFADKKEQLHFVLERFGALRFDDTEGGKVTVMGVLESRGVEFDGVIIVDFNEEKVPNVGHSDMFLSSKVRKRAGLPTRKEKEALQKHYYELILRNTKYARICYVHNEEQTPSRFLYELSIQEGARSDEVYDELLFRFSPDPTPLDFDGISFEKPTRLTPTRLQTLLDCPKRYYFEYVLELRNDIEDSEVFFGSIFHDAMKNLLENRSPFGSWRDYYEALMQEIRKGHAKETIFDVLVEREEQLKWFCQEDFERVKQAQMWEEYGQKVFDHYILAARYDRLDNRFVIDYKTGAKKESDRIQALFYAFIFDREPLFYYLKSKEIVGVEGFGIEDPKSELAQILSKIECATRNAENEKVCEWCPYRFMCKRYI